MKYLFVHQNFPGQYLHIIQHLLKDRDNDIVFISEPNKNNLPGVRRVNYQMPATTPDLLPHVQGYDTAARRALIVAGLAQNLKKLGFVPDIIIGHHGWGELLDIGDVWPGVPIFGYFEFFYSPEGQDVGYDEEFPVGPDQFARIRAMNVINLLALALDQHGQTPTNWQLTRYPEWLRRNIRLLPEGARLDLCKPDPTAHDQPLSFGDFTIAPTDKLVTYVARNLEPYRGFHVMMRALPDLLARPDVKVILVGGDDVSYGAKLANGTWRALLQHELAGKYDESRVLLPGQLSYQDYLKLLKRSDVHVYLTYPFVLSWSLREAMACGCAIVGADVDPVREFITEGKTGVLTSGLDPKGVAARTLELLDDDALRRRLGANARRYAEKHLDVKAHIAAFQAIIAELTGQPVRALPPEVVTLPNAAAKPKPKPAAKAAVAEPTRRRRG